MYFDGKTYNPDFLMREQESRYETDAFMKILINAMFTQMYANSGINELG